MKNEKDSGAQQPADGDAIPPMKPDDQSSDSKGEIENVHTPMDPTVVPVRRSKRAAGL
jgi:hypothetical protein